MVSTRGVKFVFSEGERVLCYEPDPNKAKVLYDSKILECCIGRDISSGKKCAEYLVHFYGWNSSWDRCVSEENIVKDNADSRLLQRKLAEAAALGLKGKKLKLNKIPAIIKEIVIGNSSLNAGNSNTIKDNSMTGTGVTGSSAKENEDSMVGAKNAVEEEEDEDDDDDCGLDLGEELVSVTGSMSGDASNMSEMALMDVGIDESQIQAHPQTHFYSLTTQLRQILDNDYLHTVGNKYQYHLPISPNVEEIVDSFDYSKYVAFKTISPCQQNPLIYEFKNSMMVYFNALIDNHYLFYNETEKNQYIRYIEANPDTDHAPVRVYGFVHALRMLVALPEFFRNTNGMTKKQLKLIVRLIQYFIDYLNKNKEKFYK